MNLTQQLNKLFEYDGKTSEQHLTWLSAWNSIIIQNGALLYNVNAEIDKQFLSKCKSIKRENASAWTKVVAQIFGSMLKIIKKIKDLWVAFNFHDEILPPRTLYELGMLQSHADFKTGVFTDLQVSQVSCGGMHMLLLADGRVYSKGDTSFSRLGRSGDPQELLEVDFGTEPCEAQTWRDPYEGAIYISAGYSHNFVIDVSNDIWGWGCTDSGRLGVSELDVVSWDREMTRPVRIRSRATDESSDPIKFRSVSAGSVHSVAISTSHQLYTWGSAPYTGHSCVLDPNDRKCLLDVWRPTLIPELKDIKIRQAECRLGGYHTLVLSYRGSVWSFGHDRVGQCGHEPTPWENVWTFKRQDEGYGVDTSSRSAELARVGEWRFVEEDFVELPRFIQPIKCIGGIANLLISKVRAGWGHSLFLDTSKRILACGRNTSGQIGLPPSECPQNSRWHPYMSQPRFVPGLYNITDMDTQGEASFAVDSEGRIFSWGCNSTGELSGLEEEQEYNVVSNGESMMPLLLGRETIESYDPVPRETSWRPPSLRIHLVGGTTKMYILF